MKVLRWLRSLIRPLDIELIDETMIALMDQYNLGTISPVVVTQRERISARARYRALIVTTKLDGSVILRLERRPSEIEV